MKVLVIGDPHLRRSHLTKGQELLDWVTSQVEELKPDLLVNLGDSFDTHSSISSEVLCIFNNHIDFVTNTLGKEYALILGNHDMYRPKDAKYHALQVFKNKKNVHVYDTVQSIDGITYIPFLPDPLTYPKQTEKIVFTHNTFIGADFGFKIADQGVDIDIVSADITISGHIHKRGICGNGKIHYVGTPMAISAAEVNQVKGITLFDTDTYEMKFTESPFPTWRSLALQTSDTDLNIDTINHWIVTVIGPKAEVKALLQSKKIEDLRKECSVTFKTEFTDSIKDKTKVIKTNSIESMIEQYVDKIYTGSEDRVELKKLALAAIEESRDAGN